MSYYTNPGVGNPRFPYKSFFTSIGDNTAPTEYPYNTKTNDLFTMRSFRDVTGEVFSDFTAIGHGVDSPTTYRWFANYAQTNSKLILSLSALGDPSDTDNVILDLRGTFKSPVIYFREARDYDYYDTTTGRLRFDDVRFLMNFQKYIYIGPDTNPTDISLNEYKLYVDGDQRNSGNLIVDSSVGIGTTEPSRPFHLEGVGYIRDYLVTPSIRSASEEITLEMSDLNRTIFTYFGNEKGFFDNTEGSIFVTSNVGYLTGVTSHTYKPDYLLSTVNNSQVMEQNATYTQVDNLLGVGKVPQDGQLDVDGTTATTTLRTSNWRSYDSQDTKIVMGNSNVDVYSDASIKAIFNPSAIYLYYDDENRFSVSDYTYFLSSNVGIGTSTPEYALDVQGDVRSTNSMISNNFINTVNSPSSGLTIDSAGNLFIAREGENIVSFTSTNSVFKVGTDTYLLASVSPISSSTSLYVQSDPIFRCFASRAYCLKPLAVNKSTITAGYSLDVDGDCNIVGNLYVNGTRVRTSILGTGSNSTGLFINQTTGDVTVGFQNTGSRIEIYQNDIKTITSNAYTNVELNDAFVKLSVYNVLKLALYSTYGYVEPSFFGFGGNANPAYAVDATGSIHASGDMISNQFGSVARNGGMRITSSNDLELYRDGATCFTLYSSSCEINRTELKVIEDSPSISLYTTDLSKQYSTSLSSSNVLSVLNTNGDIGWYGNGSNSSFLRGYVDYNGNWYANAFNTFSDRRIKNNIKTLKYDDTNEIIKRINPVRYNLKRGGEEQFGFIAQEVEEVCPSMVNVGKGSVDLDYTCRVMKDGDRYYMHPDDGMKDFGVGNLVNIKGVGKVEILEIDGERMYLKMEEGEGEVKVEGVEINDLKSVNYTNMIPVLVSAVQNLTAQVEKLTARLEALENMSSN